MHPEQNKLIKDDTLTETQYFGFCVPEEGIHSLKGAPNVISIRNIGMIGCVEVAPRPGGPGKRGYEIFLDCFWNQNVMVRPAGDTVVIAPPFIAEKKHVDQMIDALGKALRTVQ